MHPLSDAVPAALAAMLQRQPLTPAKVDFAWRVAVGPALARATKVTLRPDGALQVTTSDRHWLREVRSAREVILARLGRLLGPRVVRRVTVGVEDVGDARPPRRAAPQRPTPKTR